MRRYFFAGLVVWLPIWVTYILVRFIINLMDGTLALLPHQYQPHQLFGKDIPGLGLLFTIIILLITGVLVTNFIGKRLMSAWEKLIARIPLVRSIYSAVKHVVHAIAQPNGNAFRKVMLVEYPRKGVWSIAFQTADGFCKVPTEGETVTVFIPTTPNPTSGFLIIVPKKDCRELNMTTEEALRMVISLGVVMPDHLVQNATGCKTPPEAPSQY